MLKAKVIRSHMNSMLHKIARTLRVILRRVIAVLCAETDRTDVGVEADFFTQVEAFRRTEAQHRNSYRELAN